jgi:hypothetical protein
MPKIEWLLGPGLPADLVGRDVEAERGHVLARLEA